MSIHDNSPFIASDGTRRATGAATAGIDSKPVRFSAKKKSEVVLRLLRGEDIDLLSREVGIAASRIAAWREAFLEAGQASMTKRPARERDRELSRLREKLGESTRAIELLNEKISRLEANRPLEQRRSKR